MRGARVALCVRETPDQIVACVKRDLVCVKRDLVYVKRDLVWVKRDARPNCRMLALSYLATGKGKAGFHVSKET
jgi:hypothetical protein